MSKLKFETWGHNNSRAIQVDAVVVGTGILGLILAKRLVDLGQRVAIIDKSPTVANGASSMNHGWVHQGSGAVVTAEDPILARSIVKKLQYGHSFFKTYAPEFFDEPLEPTYAITADAERAGRAWEAWKDAGLDVSQVSREEYGKVNPTMNPDKASFYFKVPESRINNRLLFMKIWSEIRQKGALVYMGATYEYEGENEIRVTSEESTQTLHSPLFFYATGINLDDSYRKFTGQSLGLQFCKSHLMYLPRMTRASVIGLDPGTPIIINHANVSAVNRSFDEKAVSTNTDLATEQEEVERSLQVLYDYYPEARLQRPHNVTSRAYLKPFVNTTGRHSAEQSVFEPRPGHIFALPGKMTAAPFVADNIIRDASAALNMASITRRPFDYTKEEPYMSVDEIQARWSRPVKRPARLMRYVSAFREKL